MSCKKLINTAQTAVNDALEGLVLVNNNLTTICNGRVVARRDVHLLKSQGKVTIVTGGGSGHEPAWAGYVGCGMVTAAVCGNIFASPPSSTIYEAILCCARGNPAGTLVIVKNYTGDRVNFGLAIERARAIGLRCEMVIAADDCALTSSDRSAGRRGLCGAMFMHKVAGAMAEEGKSLDEIVMACQGVNTNMGTIGVSLGPCSLPGAEQPLFTLPKDEIELGLGIHGEAGVKRVPLMTTKEVVEAQFNHMTNPNSSTHLRVDAGDRVAVIINNLGGTSYLELNIVAKEILTLCAEKGIKVERAFCGTFVTSLEMPGVSLTLLKVDDTTIRYLDRDVGAPAWCKPWRSDSPPEFTEESLDEVDSASQASFKQVASVSAGTARVIKSAIQSACNAVKEKEAVLNDLDSGCGDGDTGFTLSQGCAALVKLVNEVTDEELSQPAKLLLSMSSIIERDMGGTSGALYSLFFSAAAAELVDDVSMEKVILAFDSGVKAIMKYGHGQRGDRTMLDALLPALEAVKQGGDLGSLLSLCAQAVRQGADSTAGMKAKSGRASYTPAEKQTKVDPGAEAVAIWLPVVCQKLSSLI